MEEVSVNRKVRVKDSEGGVHFGKVENIVEEMFEKSDLYLVRVRIDGKSTVKAYPREALTLIKTRKRKK